MGYVASMGCWYLALHRMALSKAYALLSLSYILVWGAAILLPGWGETSPGTGWWASVYYSGCAGDFSAQTWIIDSVVRV
jgi:hypothetical protein